MDRFQRGILISLAGGFMSLPKAPARRCTQANSLACRHGTFVAGILSAKRGSPAPAICPDCTLIIRPVFGETLSGSESMPSATPQELATAILDCINAGASVINLSLALAQPSINGIQALEEAFDQAIRRDVIVVAAAGNQGALGSSAITRHPWVIPVVACDDRGQPTNESNLGGSIGRRGLTALGARRHQPRRRRRAAHPGRNQRRGAFCDRRDRVVVVGFSRGERRSSQTRRYPRPSMRRRASVVPPLLDAEAAYRALSIDTGGGASHDKADR